jgi:8-oxo-dGTP pyrophosphatase MutT (NUDIX family)
MSDLQKFKAKICYTAGGLLVHNNKALLVKHKKLGIWLNPGGHIEQDELPHQAAEREFWEETGIRVKAVSPRLANRPFSTHESEHLPLPVVCNLHWVCQENYEQRLKSNTPDKRVASKIWSRGCEQHLGWFYLFKPVGSVIFKQNLEETDGISWFAKDELDNLETLESIRQEVRMGMELSQLAMQT